MARVSLPWPTSRMCFYNVNICIWKKWFLQRPGPFRDQAPSEIRPLQSPGSFRDQAPPETRLLQWPGSTRDQAPSQTRLLQRPGPFRDQAPPETRPLQRPGQRRGLQDDKDSQPTSLSSSHLPAKAGWYQWPTINPRLAPCTLCVPTDFFLGPTHVLSHVTIHVCCYDAWQDFPGYTEAGWQAVGGWDGTLMWIFWNQDRLITIQGGSHFLVADSFVHHSWGLFHGCGPLWSQLVLALGDCRELF